MSRYYGMSVTVRDEHAALQEGLERIRQAVDEEWDMSDEYEGEYEDGEGAYVVFEGNGNLCGGESEEEFVSRVTAAIWKAYGKYCEVEVIATYLEDPPYETYTCKEKEYERWRKTNGKQ